MDILAETLQVDGALPAVRTLNVAFGSNLNNPTPPFLPKLARAFIGGALPLLEELDVKYGMGLDDLQLTVVADMLENRARIPGCHGLKTLDGLWLAGPPQTKI